MTIPQMFFIFAVLFLSGCVSTGDQSSESVEDSASDSPAFKSSGKRPFVDDDGPEELMVGSPPTIRIPPVEDNEILELGELQYLKGLTDTVESNHGVLLAKGFRKQFQRKQDRMGIFTLNIGAGSCHVISCLNSDLSMVVGCGSMKPSAKDMSPKQVKNLFNKVIKDEYILVLSHGDRDHVNLINNALADRVPRSIWLGGKFDSYKGSAATYLDTWGAKGVTIKYGWRSGYSNKGRPVRELSCGDANDYILTVNVGDSKNSQSLMLLVEYGKFSAVFSGDAHGISEKSAMKNFGALLDDVSLLTASHHGARSKGSNHDAWTDKLSPRVILYSSGTSHGHPNKSISERYHDDIDDGAKPHQFWTATNSNSGYTQSRTVRREYELP